MLRGAAMPVANFSAIRTAMCACQPKPLPSCWRTASSPFLRRRCWRWVGRNRRQAIVLKRADPVTFGDLTTLADVKAWLQTGQAAFPAADDALLTRLVTAASQYIQTWLNRGIASADFLEVRDGTGGCRLQFACFPATAVLSLTFDGQAVPAATSFNAAGYRFRSTQLSVRGYSFKRGAQNVIIAYTAGYAA